MKYLFLLLLPIVTSCTTHTSKEQMPERLEVGECLEGTTRTGYSFPTAMGAETCSQASQFCVQGQWQGPTLYDSCIEQFKNCGAALHGTVETGYQSPTVPNGSTCIQTSRTCLEGSWNGPELYSSCTELP
ncbi:hypothetical protein C0V70_03245 [Bacteriovorax stolpii]|uniref:Uncharacterized protein n=1 Tax=Bacteriovorax stolpii TaxID=960 RepID=A0A2K9NNP5_BACTC|nr:hypothetical protein [Bacteriovorax stolpii]AUN97139.1 hypothetical protein C0V70_03245 [Bacteriovorax stolpii]TDP53425.1 hypothetical protein C8D79_2068 [Bacteriovorax stolpii]